MGSRSTKKHIRLCRFFTWIPGKMENGEPRMLCFAVVFLVFWGTLPPFRSRMGPGPGNLSFCAGFRRGFGMELWGFRTRKWLITTANMCVLRVRRWRSAELKKHQIWQRICRYFWHFHADVKKSARKGPINDSVEQLLSYPFPEIGEITMQNDWKSIRGVAKTHVLHFRESSKIPTYLLWYFDDLETRLPEFHDFHPKRYILCFKR